MIARVQRLLLPAARTRVGHRLFRCCYGVTLRVVVADLRRDAAVSAIVMRSAFDNPWFCPLISDIDLLLVCSDDGADLELEVRERLYKRLRMWKRFFPHFKGGWITMRSAMCQAENDVVVTYVALDDASVVYGELDRASLLRLYRPDQSVARYLKAAWLYASTVQSLLYMSVDQRRLLNCDKVFAKVLVFAGYSWADAQGMIRQIFGGIGLPDAPERVEAATPELLRFLTAKLSGLPFAKRPTQFAIRVDGDARALPSPDPAPVPAEEAPWAQRLMREMECDAPGFEIRIYRTTEESDSLIAFAKFPTKHLRADLIRRLVDSWRRLEVEERSSDQLSAFLPAPIIVDQQMMRLCLLLNIRDCNQSWQSYLRLEQF